VANFSRFHKRSPDKLGIEEVRAYRLHLMNRGLEVASINPIVGALRFFYGTILGQKQVAEQIPFGRTEDTLPAVLTQSDVVRLLKAEPNLKMRTALTTNLRGRLACLRDSRANEQGYQQQAHGDPRPSSEGA
jgi:integrase/recombinase XerD